MQAITITFAWVGLALLASGASAADSMTGSAEVIYKSSHIIDYSANTLSPDQTQLLLVEWGRNSKSRTLSQTIKIVNLSNGDIVSKNSFSTRDRIGTGLLDLGTVNWDGRSTAVFFALVGNEGRIYQWDVKTGRYKEILNAHSPIMRISASPDGKAIALIDYDSSTSSRLRLKIHTRETGEITQVDSDVELPAPMWKDDSMLLFVKKDALWGYSRHDDHANKVADIPPGRVRSAQLRHNDHVFIVLDEETDGNHGELGAALNPIREVWRYELAARKREMLIAFKSSSSGIAIDDDHLILPLSGADARSELVLFNLSNRLLQAIPTQPLKSDLPLYVGEKNLVLFRSDNRQLLRTRY